MGPPRTCVEPPFPFRGIAPGCNFVHNAEEHKQVVFRSMKTRVTSVKRILTVAEPSVECLVQIYGKDLGKRYELTDSTMSIGRDPENDVVVDTDSVSRRHALIEVEGQERYIVDQGSTNGTYLNDALIERAQLRTGDLLKIGDTIFKFLCGKDIESSYHEEIYRMTISDGLTQIANKRYLLEFLEGELSRSKRYERNLALIMLDIDHFKNINDEFGHLTGDFVLKEMANLVRKRIRREELFARYGGEEFAIVLPETDEERGRDFAEIIRGLIEKATFEFEGNLVPVTISLGVAARTDDTVTPQDLIRLADERLYRAKRSGRNRVV